MTVMCDKARWENTGDIFEGCGVGVWGVVMWLDFGHGLLIS